MGKVCWDFPLLGTGSMHGNNDAAITMFKGTGIMDGLAREVCQNSLDARDKTIPNQTPVLVKFKLFELERNKYDVFDGLKTMVDGAHEYWNNNRLKTPEIMNYLEMISKYLNMEKIPVLVMSDYNTIGLNVKEGPDGVSYWHLLVDTEGISIKQDKNSGGSFGIGKNAPFAYSGLSTVFYNTLAKNGDRAFEGVSHLVTTQREHNGEKRPTYPSGKYLYLIDEYTGRPILPEDQCSLAGIHEFNRNSVGTDVAIFGFKTEEYENWEKAVAVAVLKNFILAVKDRKLEVEIESPKESYIISNDSIDDLLYKEFKDNKSLDWTRQIYETVKTEPHLVKIAEQNDLSIFVRYDDNYKASLSRFRSTGMLINTTMESLPHYSVVIIVNDVGEMELSKTLREAEPPQHTEWKAKNITNNRPLYNRAAKYIRNINKAIQSVLDEFERADISEQMDAGIGDYLPDTSGSASGEGADGLRVDVRVNEISTYDGKVYYQNQYESASTNTGAPTDSTGVKAGDKNHKKKKKRKIKVVVPGDSNEKGVSPGEGKVRIVSLSLSDHRIFYLAGNKYKLLINSESNYKNVYMKFYAGRDDYKQDPINVKNIKTDGMPLIDVNGDKVGPVLIKEGENNFYIEFENREIMAVIPVFTMEVKLDEK